MGTPRTKHKGGFPHSFRYAFNGLRRLFEQEINARIHLVIMVLTLVAGFVFQLSSMEWIVLVIVIGMVLSAEALNSALERLADRITTQFDPMIGQAKDLAAGAVVITALSAVVVGCIIFIPKIWAWLA